MLPLMKPVLLGLCLLYITPASALWAAPGQLENNNYKVVFSETLPGIDSPGAILPPGAGITVTVTDKFRSQQVNYPLTGYAVPNYFLLNDTLNLILRATLANSPTEARYNFLQLDLSDSSNSHQLTNLRQYSFSPDRQNLFMVVAQDNGAPWLGLARLAENPLDLQWLYAEGAGANVFKSTFQGPVTALTVWAPVGWSADSLSAAFLFSVDEGAKDGQGNPALKDVLAFLELGDKGWQASARPVDLSSYHFHAGAALTDLKYDGQKARLFFTSDRSTTPVEADFNLTQP